MRRTLAAACVAFTSTLLVAPPAGAEHLSEPEPPECPAPVTVERYDSDELTVTASLPASSCPSRQERQYSLGLSVTRYDDTSAYGVTRAVLCGPADPCDIDLTLGHPKVEEATYIVDVSYPGPDGEETSGYEMVCVSDETGAGCRDLDG